ncbi:uncharacterized protein LOC116617844 [Nematostella vectensis]|uniref:uncharacterized protein LOC116617844 n=1 Tax=Nematostella vectensis TaxID=45351 RepID=UPI00138FC198|nr:uncharacterized protein LOC116617844 [Nematostella vectensis]
MKGKKQKKFELSLKTTKKSCVGGKTIKKRETDDIIGITSTSRKSILSAFYTASHKPEDANIRAPSKLLTADNSYSVASSTGKDGERFNDDPASKLENLGSDPSLVDLFPVCEDWEKLEDLPQINVLSKELHERTSSDATLPQSNRTSADFSQNEPYVDLPSLCMVCCTRKKYTSITLDSIDTQGVQSSNNENGDKVEFFKEQKEFAVNENNSYKDICEFDSVDLNAVFDEEDDWLADEDLTNPDAALQRNADDKLKQQHRLPNSSVTSISADKYDKEQCVTSQYNKLEKPNKKGLSFLQKTQSSVMHKNKEKQDYSSTSARSQKDPEVFVISDEEDEEKRQDSRPQMNKQAQSTNISTPFNWAKSSIQSKPVTKTTCTFTSNTIMGKGYAINSNSSKQKQGVKSAAPTSVSKLESVVQSRIPFTSASTNVPLGSKGTTLATSSCNFPQQPFSKSWGSSQVSATHISKERLHAKKVTNIQESLSVCPMCQYKFPPNVNTRDVEKHISSCINDEDLFFDEC